MTARLVGSAVVVTGESAGIGAGIVEPTPYRRRGTPAGVAGVVSFLCSPDAQFVSGTSWAVDGGWSSY